MKLGAVAWLLSCLFLAAASEEGWQYLRAPRSALSSTGHLSLNYHAVNNLIIGGPSKDCPDGQRRDKFGKCQPVFQY